tara:strand:- start:16808 stop:17467 length:660 start_codon:yes stop_codon:yes gene_type:complete
MIDRSSYIEILVSFASRPLLEKFKKTSLSANNITVLGAILGLSGGIIFFLGENFLSKFLSFILVYLYLVFDFIDGDLARYKNQASDKGYFLDIFFDKLILIILIVTVLVKIDFGIPELEPLFILMSFLPLYFQFNLVIFTNLKKKGVDVVNWSENTSSENIKQKLIIIYRRLFFPTHINTVFLLSFGLLLDLEIYAFLFVTITALIAILRQFYIIITKL